MQSASPLRVLLLAAFAAGFASCTSRPAGVATPAGREQAAEWELVWADEFDEEGRPNPVNWTYETGFVRNEDHALAHAFGPFLRVAGRGRPSLDLRGTVIAARHLANAATE